MKENGFYILDSSYVNLVNRIGGTYNDNKARPIFCCLKDKFTDGLYWLIPTSDLSHRSPEQIQKYQDFQNYKDIRSAYYHIGTTSKPALFKISNALPVSDKYISKDYIVNGTPLVMKNSHQISEIQNKLNRILAFEAKKPNSFEQHITALKEYVCAELNLQRATQINDLSSQVSKLNQDNIDLNNKNEILQEKIDDLISKNTELQTQLDESLEKFKNLSCTNEKLQSEIQRYKALIASTNKFINENPIVLKEFLNNRSETNPKELIPATSAPSHKSFSQGVDELAGRHSGKGTSKSPTHNSTDETLNGTDSKFRK